MPNSDVRIEHSAPTRLLVTGVPCTGKTTFARWLAEEHGFISCHSDFNPNSLQNAVSAANAGRPVIIDWGFPVSGLGLARQLIQQAGFQAWWFDGDIATSHQVFLDRSGHQATLNDWQRYIEGIGSHSAEYSALYGDRLIRTLEPGPRWAFSNEEIWTLVNNYLPSAS